MLFFFTSFPIFSFQISLNFSIYPSVSLCLVVEKTVVGLENLKKKTGFFCKFEGFTFNFWI